MKMKRGELVGFQGCLGYEYDKGTNELSLIASEEKEMKTRLKSFRKYFDANKPLKKFDADVFESIVEKIILGGIDNKGKKDPHQLTFVFKTGPKSTITMEKELYPQLLPATFVYGSKADKNKVIN